MAKEKDLINEINQAPPGKDVGTLKLSDLTSKGELSMDELKTVAGGRGSAPGAVLFVPEGMNVSSSLNIRVVNVSQSLMGSMVAKRC